MGSVFLIIVGAVIVAIVCVNAHIASNEYERYKSDLTREVFQKQSELDKLIKEQKQKCAELAEAEKKFAQKQQAFDRAFEEKTAFYPYLAAIKADFQTIYFEEAAKQLCHKYGSGYDAVYTVKRLRKDASNALAEATRLKYLVNYICKVYPDAVKFVNGESVEKQTISSNPDDTTQSGAGSRLEKQSPNIDGWSAREAGNCSYYIEELQTKESEIANLKSRIGWLNSKLSELQRQAESVEAPKQLLAQAEASQAELKKLDRTLKEKYINSICTANKIRSFNDCFGNIPLEESLKRISKLADDADIRDLTYDAHATVVSSDGSGEYVTTLDSCNCPDFQRRHDKQPCKHMYRLALEMGLLPIMLKDVYPDIKSKIAELHDEFDCTSKKIAECQRLDSALAQREKRLRDLDVKLKQETDQRYPWLAECIANWRVGALNVKIRNDIDKRGMKKLLRDAEKENIELKNQIAFYEYLFPVLEDFGTLPPSNAIRAASHESGELSYQWLSKEEYEVLSRPEKLQMWLDNYFGRRSKNSWEAGIKYERYIGYRCEKEGCVVKYSGATLGLNDMGRDLIARRGNTTYVVQCKRYKDGKETHENHIFQLFGSVMHYKKDVGEGKNVIGVFVTTSTLSQIARECADNLGITVYENIPFEKYPLIKCNVSRNGEKIYHLPFDQQYDTASITFKNGECYAATISEAESLGFRKAMKHMFNNNNE